MDFIYQALPARVIFGAGSVARIGEELERLGVARALVLSTPGRAESACALMARIGPRAASLYAGARMHTPVEVTLDAMRALETAKADGILAIGGGSTIGLGKALALRTDLRKALVDEDLRKIEVWTARHGIAIADWPDRPVDPFLNVNTPDDVERATRIALQHAAD